MRKLALSFVSILAVAALLAACSDDNGTTDSKPPGENVQFDTGPDSIITVPEAGGDTMTPSVTCDATFLGKYCSSKKCAADTDCTGVGTGKCAPSGFCEDNPCGATDTNSNLCLSLGTETDGSRWGICTCSCTPDDPGTQLVVEDTCPDLAHHQCSSELEVTINAQCKSTADCTVYGPSWTCEVATGICKGSEAFCLKFCDPKIGTNTCDGKLTCDPGSGGTWGIFDKAVCSQKGCTTNDRCPIDTGVACNPKTNDCATGQKCLVLDIRGDTNGCTQDADCNDANYVCADLEGSKYCTYKEGRCAKPGQCDTVSGQCDVAPAGLFKAGAKVGDACKADVDCEKNQTCLFELDFSAILKKKGATCADNSECCSNNCANGTCGDGGLCTVHYRNGYCTTQGCSFATTLTQFACDAGSDCNNLYSGGFCQKKCTLADATSCRNNASDYLGDYECRAWNNLAVGTVNVTTGPVCDFGTGMACDTFGTTSTLDCTSVGDQGNPTNMKCRNLDGNATTNAKDPNGFCLDDTKSGTTVRNPLPTP